MDEPPPSPRFDVARALAGLAGRKSALVYMHDNPDPDALAAALGLGRLLEHELGAAVTLGHGGIVGRAQNRAMVDTLGMPLAPVEKIDPDAFDLIAIVDSQPETGNNSLPPGHRIDVVVDHHPVRPASARAPWCDIRPDFGATSTIVFEYLRARGHHPRRQAGDGVLLRAAHGDARPRPRIDRGRADRLPRAGPAGRSRAALPDEPPQGAARTLRGARSRAALGAGVRRRSSR